MSRTVSAPRVNEVPVRRRRRGPVLVSLLGLLLACVLVFHVWIPDIAGVGLFVDSLLPWLGLAIVPLSVLAISVRARRSWLAVLAPFVVWCVMFVPQIVPLAAASSDASAGSLTVASQNVEEASRTGVESALALADEGADVIALQEMDGAIRAEIDDALAESYPHRFAVGTVGIWSRYPLVNTQPLQLGLGWNRALAGDIETPDGLVSVYVVHVASARPDDVDSRDTMLAELAATLPNDENERAVVVGDFNAASTDRSFGPVEQVIGEPQQTGGGFGFTWPSGFPAVRLDHVLVKGMEVTENRTVRAGGSDHLAVVARMEL